MADDLLDFSTVQDPYSYTGPGDSTQKLLDDAISSLSSANVAGTAQNVMDLPSTISSNTQARLDNAKIGTDDILKMFSDVGNVGAQKNIFGGTEFENLAGSAAASMTGDLQTLIDSILADEGNLQTSAALAAPESLNSLLSGTQYSYATDPTQWGALIVDLIKSGFTG